MDADSFQEITMPEFGRGMKNGLGGVAAGNNDAADSKQAGSPQSTEDTDNSIQTDRAAVDNKGFCERVKVNFASEVNESSPDSSDKSVAEQTSDPDHTRGEGSKKNWDEVILSYMSPNKNGGKALEDDFVLPVSPMSAQGLARLEAMRAAQRRLRERQENQTLSRSSGLSNVGQDNVTGKRDAAEPLSSPAQKYRKSTKNATGAHSISGEIVSAIASASSQLPRPLHKSVLLTKGSRRDTMEIFNMAFTSPSKAFLLDDVDRVASRRRRLLGEGKNAQAFGAAEDQSTGESAGHQDVEPFNSDGKMDNLSSTLKPLQAVSLQSPSHACRANERLEEPRTKTETTMGNTSGLNGKQPLGSASATHPNGEASLSNKVDKENKQCQKQDESSVDQAEDQTQSAPKRTVRRPRTAPALRSPSTIKGTASKLPTSRLRPPTRFGFRPK